MKTLAILTLFLASCAIEETTVTTTDAKSGLVTVTTRKSKKADTAWTAIAGDVVAAYSPPRARRVREEKSGTPDDLRRILHRPITRQEIANRWKP